MDHQQFDINLNMEQQAHQVLIKAETSRENAGIIIDSYRFGRRKEKNPTIGLTKWGYVFVVGKNVSSKFVLEHSRLL